MKGPQLALSFFESVLFILLIERLPFGEVPTFAAAIVGSRGR
jgi:hypothetical protein